MKDEKREDEGYRCYMLRLLPEDAAKFDERARRVRLSPGVYLRECVKGMLDGNDAHDLQDLAERVTVLQEDISEIKAEVSDLAKVVRRYLTRTNQILEQLETEE